jgi:subtilase family serine protease
VLPAPSSARRRALTAVLATSAVLLASLAATPAHADERRVALPGDRPAMTAAAAGHATAVASTDPVQVEVVFDLQDEAGAEALATAVATPGSPQYRRFVAPADWIARFAPTRATVDAFVAVAQQYDVQVVSMPASRLFVLVTGTDADIEHLFGTDLRTVHVHGQSLVEPVGSVSLPASGAAGVRTAGFGRLAMTSRAVPAKASGSSAARCSTWWKQHTARIPKAYGTRTAPTALCGYSSAQLRAASGVAPSATDGTGQTIAVIDALGSSSITADLATWSARNHLPAARYSQLVPARGSWDTSASCAPADWQGEQTLDLEAAHAIAPGAGLLYVGASDCGAGFDTAMSQVLDQGLATIVSNSYGRTGGDTFADPDDAQIALGLHQHLQAAGQGIGLYFASGDSGDDSAYFGGTAVDFPASSPWVTAVGGTTTALDRRSHVVFRAAWGDRIAVARTGASRWTVQPKGDFLGGAGGGASSLFAQPAYQAGVVPSSIAGGMRAETDVSALADPFTGLAVGMRIGGRYTTTMIGGTSLATPIVAAQMALAQQAAGRTIGFANPVLYAARGALTDVAPSAAVRFAAVGGRGTVALVTFDQDTSLKARRGYDLPTGLGVLTAASRSAIAGY